MVSRAIALLLCVALVSFGCSDRGGSPPVSPPEPPATPAPVVPAPPAPSPAPIPAPAPAGPDASADVARNEIAVLQMEGGGEIHLRLLPDKAPRHVANFKALARQGFYDGTTFHRVIPDFMIQGGDPNTRDEVASNDGNGGPPYTIAAEFNDVPHRRGIVSMARRSEPDSAGSQFFIMVADAPRGSRDWGEVLDGRYTVFGEVTRGMEVADAIVDAPRDARDRPLADQRILHVRIVPAS